MMDNSIEDSIAKYNKLKIEFLKITQCLEHCEEEDREFYFKVTEDYARKLKIVNQSMKEKYGLKLCDCSDSFLLSKYHWWNIDPE